jgi:uncharacterized membrane protein HdeD (DUF308 family)
MNYDLSLPVSSSLMGTLGITVPGVSGQLLWIILGILAIVLGFVTIVLYYHWMRYAYGNKMVLFAQIIYTLVTVAGLIVMASAINYYA